MLPSLICLFSIMLEGPIDHLLELSFSNVLNLSISLSNDRNTGLEAASILFIGISFKYYLVNMVVSSKVEVISIL